MKMSLLIILKIDLLCDTVKIFFKVSPSSSEKNHMGNLKSQLKDYSDSPQTQKYIYT